MEIEAEIRKVGNSAAILIPKEVMDKQNLAVEDKVKVIILPKKTLGQVLWGRGKFREPADKLKRELKKLKWVDG